MEKINALQLLIYILEPHKYVFSIHIIIQVAFYYLQIVKAN